MRYTEHAEERMQQRGVSEEEVVKCMRNGQWFSRKCTGTHAHVIQHAGVCVMMDPFARSNVVKTVWKGEVGPSYTKRQLTRRKPDTKYQDAKHVSRVTFRD